MRRISSGGLHGLWRRMRGAVVAREDGTTALELALVLPVFLTLILGAADFGQAVIYSNVAAAAARDGARAAQVQVPFDVAATTAAGAPSGTQEAALTDATIAAAIRSAAQDKAGSFAGKLTITPYAGGNATDGYYVKVVASATYTPVAGTLLRVGTKPVSATSRLYIG